MPNIETLAGTSGSGSYSGNVRTRQTAGAGTSPSTTAWPEVDSFEPSGALAGTASEASAESAGTWQGFDLEAFQSEMRDRLLEQIASSREELQAAGVPLYSFADGLYQVPDETEAAEVPEEWNADNTSDRIVSFALAFRGLEPDLSDEEFVAKIRASIQEGFRQAGDDLGDLPAASGKLFNDTYDAAMEKLDEALKQMQASSTATSSGGAESSSSRFSVLA